jgi:hypothetical protein
MHICRPEAAPTLQGSCTRGDPGHSCGAQRIPVTPSAATATVSVTKTVLAASMMRNKPAQHARDSDVVVIRLPSAK